MGCQGSEYRPMPLEDPGRTSEVVVPPAIDNWYASSWVFKLSRARNQGCTTPLYELSSMVLGSSGDGSSPMCECMSTILSIDITQ